MAAGMAGEGEGGGGEKGQGMTSFLSYLHLPGRQDGTS